ncbi:MAG: hypothetical protein JNJ99_00790 [Crocinitomicaceae bacterium]|nr:hypothetical protein [Crocinitomicaceae bacterium]
MKTKSYLYLTISILFFSCAGSNTTEQESEKDTVIVEPTVEADENDIQLNNGAKWKLDEKMMSFIMKIEEDATGFSKDAKTKSIEMYNELASSISTNLDSLTSNCTMSGQAHDELHKWLLPFLDLNEEFSASTVVVKSDSHYKHILNSLGEFHQNFQKKKTLLR